MRIFALLAMVGSSVLVGCGPECRSTCERVYDDAQCGVTIAGADEGELIDDCERICNNALQVPGPAVDPSDRRFNPGAQVISSSAEDRELANENEAGAWIDCVWTFNDAECPDKLDDQYCISVF